MYDCTFFYSQNANISLTSDLKCCMMIMVMIVNLKEKLIIQLVDMEELKDENKRLRESLEKIKSIK